MKPTEEIRRRALSEGVFSYLAWVPADGYEWRSDLKPWPPPRAPRTSKDKAGLTRSIEWEPAPDPPPYLVGPAPVGVGAYSHPRGVLREGRHRDDGIHEGLHRRFAALARQDEIKAFADRFGDLGQGATQVSEGIGGSMWAGESLDLWKREAGAMASLLETWEHVASGDHRAELRRRVQWHNGPPLTVMWWPEGVGEGRPCERLAEAEYEDPRFGRSRGEAPAALRRWTFGDALEPARHYVHREVNGRLAGHVNARVLPYADAAYRITFTPDSLLAALYVLFALELAKDEPMRICAYEACGAAFSPRRRNQHYCSDACRRNASYHRVKAKGGIS